MSKLHRNERLGLQALVAELHQQFSNRVRQIVLYGSKARGDSTPDSDIDILIVLNEEDSQIRRQILTIASRMSLEYDVLLNPVIVSTARFKRQRGFTFYQNAARDAIQLTLQQGQLTLAPGMPQPGG